MDGYVFTYPSPCQFMDDGDNYSQADGYQSEFSLLCLMPGKLHDMLSQPTYSQYLPGPRPISICTKQGRKPEEKDRFHLAIQLQQLPINWCAWFKICCKHAAQLFLELSWVLV